MHVCGRYGCLVDFLNLNTKKKRKKVRDELNEVFSPFGSYIRFASPVDSQEENKKCVVKNLTPQRYSIETVLFRNAACPAFFLSSLALLCLLTLEWGNIMPAGLVYLSNWSGSTYVTVAWSPIIESIKPI